MQIYVNEYGEKEIGFQTKSVAEKVLYVSQTIDKYCHSKADNYMMELLAKITNLAIEKGYITYKQLYLFNEEEIFLLLKSKNDKTINDLIFVFENAKISDLKDLNLPKVKIRELNPIVNGKRII